MIFNMGLEDICDIGLGLGLGLRLGNNQVIKVIDGSDSSSPSKKPCFGFETFVPSASTSSELSLALGLSDEAAGHVKPCMNRKCEESVIVNRPASPHSTVSSFSNTRVARKRVFVSEEIDFERVSSRISDEDEDSNVRKKLRLTKEQSALLEDSFKEHTTLNPQKQKQALAKQLNLRPRQVEVWFQNRRARTKLKQTEVDCEFLKKCCETLTEENRRLHKELQDLKALKLAPSPLYMKLPAATLTMCPSCKRINSGGVDSKESFAVTPKSQLYNPFTHPSAAC